MIWRQGAFALAFAGAGACAGTAAPSDVPAAARRAIFVSFDAMNEERARRTVDPAAIPALLRFFQQASCTDGARPMWPSVTAASHAALWTGAYGNVNGVAANTQAPIPWAEFSLTELRSGFEARELRAEPIWIAAARAGRTVVGHQVTQAGEPGRWRPEGGRDTALVRRDSAALADPRLFLLNGYTGGPEPRLLTAADNPPRPAPPWRGTEQLGASLPLREVAWAIGGDSVFALFFGSGRYTEVLVSPRREVAAGVRVRLVPPESAPPAGRELARHFSPVLWLPDQTDWEGAWSGTGRSGVYFRLWELAPDLSSYQLYQSGRNGIRANQPEVLRSYEDAVGGFVGNLSASGDITTHRSRWRELTNERDTSVVADAVVECLAPVRERYEALAADPGEVRAVLARGADKAEAIAGPVLERVKKAVGLLER